MLLSEDGLNRVRSKLTELPATTMVLAESSLELPPTEAQVVRLPFASTAKQVGKLSIGTAALGALLAQTGLYPVEAFGEAITSFQGATIAAINSAALAAGAALSQAPEA